MKFNAYLKQIREKRDMTKTELARKVGISIQYVVEVESGRSKPPTLERCQQIAKALALSEDEKNTFVNLAALERASKELKPFVAKEPQTPYAAGDSQQDPLEFAKKIVGKDNVFLFRAPDDSMAEAGINMHDRVIVEEYKGRPDKEDIIVAKVGKEVIIRRFSQYGSTIVLEPANRKYDKKEFTSWNSIKMNGVVRGVLWKGLRK